MHKDFGDPPASRWGQGADQQLFSHVNLKPSSCLSPPVSNGYVVDEAGIKLDTVKRIKEVERGRIKLMLPQTVQRVRGIIQMAAIFCM